MTGARPTPRISAIVVNRDRAGLLGRCLEALRVALERLDPPGEAIVVDNASSDASVELVRDRFGEMRLLTLDENRGFPAAVNAGLEVARGEWVLLINNDATIAPGAAAELLRVGGSESKVGGVAAQMRFADRPGIVNSAGIGVDRLAVAYDRLLGRPASDSETEPVEVFGASGGAALLRRDMLDEIGGFDGSLFFSLDDVDVAWRARMRGWRFVYAPAAVVYHDHGATIGHGSGSKYFHVGRNRVRLIAKNATTGQLVRYGAGMVLYDLAYVAFVAARDRDLAPLRGRLRGLGEWRRYRRAGAAGRAPVELEPIRGIGAALHRRRAWAGGRSTDR